MSPSIKYLAIVPLIILFTGCNRHDGYQKLVEVIETKDNASSYSDEVITEHAHQIISEDNVAYLFLMPLDHELDINTRHSAINYIFAQNVTDSEKPIVLLYQELIDAYDKNPNDDNADNLSLVVTYTDQIRENKIISASEVLGQIAARKSFSGDVHELVPLSACDAWLSIREPDLSEFLVFSSMPPSDSRRRSLVAYASVHFGYDKNWTENWQANFSDWLDKKANADGGEVRSEID